MQPHQQHRENHFKQSDFVKDIVIGMADGLTVPFALAAGLSGAVSDNDIIVTAGIAEICAGSIAMGLGGYMAGKTEIDHYKAELEREHREVLEYHDEEKEEVKEIFREYGLSESAQETIVNELVKDKDKWVEFMMRFELGLEKPDIHRARKSAMNIGVAYVVGGIIPLCAYIFTDIPSSGLMYSSIITILCLFIFGYIKSRFMDMNPWEGAFKTTGIGVIAASAAYFIAKQLGG
jgi:vacuolar iron transporter family protein